MTDVILLGVIVILLEVASENADYEICQKKDGKFPKAGSSCKRYYQCNDWVPVEKRCSRGYRFNENKGSCDWKGFISCPENEVVDGYKCPRRFDLFTFPKDCSKYYLCWKRKSIIKTCKCDRLFDENKKRCAQKELVHCGSRFNPYGLSTTEKVKSTVIFTSFTPTARDTTLPEKVTFTPEIGEVTTSKKQNIICPKPLGHFPHPTDEHKFIVCDNNVPSIFDCPAKLVYNDNLNRCDYKEL